MQNPPFIARLIARPAAARGEKVVFLVDRVFVVSPVVRRVEN